MLDSWYPLAICDLVLENLVLIETILSQKHVLFMVYTFDT
jgi:hypothetical protein